MKTYKIKNQKTEAQNRPEQSGTDNRPKIDMKRRFTNRAMDTENVLALLRSEAPSFFAVAEVVGKWIWIQFDEKQSAPVTSALSEFGFHWNNTRQTWQHPCGTVVDDRANYDPRKRYGSYFATEAKAA